MSIRSNGEFIVPGQRASVHAFLTDPSRFAPLLPDFKSLEIEDEKSFVVKLRVGVSNIRGTALIRLELCDNQPPEKAVFKGSGKLPGGAAELTAQFDLEDTGSGTDRWQNCLYCGRSLGTSSQEEPAAFDRWTSECPV
jgi:carbon monoxide dehydrogenase subunit G